MKIKKKTFRYKRLSQTCPLNIRYYLSISSPRNMEKKSPGGNTPQSTNYTATCPPSRKLSKLDEPDMQDTAGEAGTIS